MSRRPSSADWEAARAQAERLGAEPLLGQAVRALTVAVAVLNARQQVVFANPAFEELVGATGGFVGLKPGELFRCVHAGGTSDGCGESPECRFCGASRVFLEARDSGRASRREFAIAGRSGEREVPYDLEAAGTPFRIAGEQFVLLTLRDVSLQKHKAALERIFFHDILNTASSLKIYLNLLANSGPEESGRRSGGAVIVRCLEHLTQRHHGGLPGTDPQETSGPLVAAPGEELTGPD